MFVAGAKYSVRFEELLTRVLKEDKKSKVPIILFIDGIGLVLGTSASCDGVLNVTNTMKQLLSQGELRCIAR